MFQLLRYLPNQSYFLYAAHRQNKHGEYPTVPFSFHGTVLTRRMPTPLLWSDGELSIRYDERQCVPS